VPFGSKKKKLVWKGKVGRLGLGVISRTLCHNQPGDLLGADLRKIQGDGMVVSRPSKDLLGRSQAPFAVLEAHFHGKSTENW